MQGDVEEMVQIIPATGWAAAYETRGELSFNPLACFAYVILRDGRRVVAGMDPARGDIGFAEDRENFVGYAYLGQEARTDETILREDARRRSVKRGLRTEFS